jgi:hypothetical protein
VTVETRENGRAVCRKNSWDVVKKGGVGQMSSVRGGDEGASGARIEDSM